MSDNSAWLDRTIELALEPELPICDPHHHLWDHPGSRYLLDELLQDTNSGHNIVSTVFVECMAMYRKLGMGPEELRVVGETEFVQGIAAQSASGNYGDTKVAAGIVGMADLTLGADVERVLEAHLAASPNRFRGIRHAATWHASPDIRNSHVNATSGLLLDSKFRQGFACLQKYGLSFDAWLYHTQLLELADLAKAFPATTIILDHVGGPLGIGAYAGKRHEVFQQWQHDISIVAECPNVVVKLGGLNMKLNGFGWHKQQQPPGSEALAAANRPYFEHCIEQFGVGYCMFESNFPVDKASCSYAVLWNSFKRVTESYSATERAALFHDTAARVYQL